MTLENSHAICEQVRNGKANPPVFPIHAQIQSIIFLELEIDYRGCVSFG